MMPFAHHMAVMSARSVSPPPPPILLDLDADFLRICDIARRTNGYGVSVHLFPNNVIDNWATYIDTIAHRRHMGMGNFRKTRDQRIWSIVNPPSLRRSATLP